MGRYKRPRTLNTVTFLLIIILGGGGYWVSKMWPIFRAKSTSKVILRNAANKFFSFHHHRGTLRGDEERALRQDVIRQFRELGVTDPNLEVTLEEEPKFIRVGANFTMQVKFFWDKKPQVHVLSPSAETSTERPFQ